MYTCWRYTLALIVTAALVAATTTAITVSVLSGPRASTNRTQAAWEGAPHPADQAAAVRRQLEEQNALLTAMIEEQQRLAAELGRIAPLVPAQYRMLVIEAAQANSLDPKLIAQVGYVESRWDPNARGTSGEVGIMQIMPDTAAWIARSMGITTYDLTDPATNIAMGAHYLRHLINEYGNTDHALAAYNGGHRAHERKPLSARGYIDRVRTAGQNGR